MIASLRYSDTFAKIDGAWYFAERRLYADWLEAGVVVNAQEHEQYPQPDRS